MIADGRLPSAGAAMGANGGEHGELLRRPEVAMFGVPGAFTLDLLERAPPRLRRRRRGLDAAGVDGVACLVGQRPVRAWPPGRAHGRARAIATSLADRTAG